MPKFAAVDYMSAGAMPPPPAVCRRCQAAPGFFTADPEVADWRCIYCGHYQGGASQKVEQVAFSAILPRFAPDLTAQNARTAPATAPKALQPLCDAAGISDF